MRLAEIAEKVEGELIGGGDFEVRDVAELDSSSSDTLSFVESAKMISGAAGALIVPPGVDPPCPAIRCENPRLGFARAVALLRPAKLSEPGIHPSAIIDSTARVGEGAFVGPAATLGPNVEIGDGCQIGAGVRVGEGARMGTGCVIHPNCVLYAGVSLGDRVILHAGAVIGSDGFGYVPDGEGGVEKFPQTGTVVIEDEVEIGANTTVDRGAVGETRIMRGTKIDNLVQVAHNVTIGEGCLIASQVGISGSVRIGSGVIMGGQVGIADHVEIGDGAVLGAMTGVSKSLEGGKTYLDAPAAEISEARRRLVVYMGLPALSRRLRVLEGKMEDPES